jgi:glycosyltransferase involved in cell wall biosynthesis
VLIREASQVQEGARLAGDDGRVPLSFNLLMIAPTSFFADYGCHVRILEEAQALQRLGQRLTIVTYYQGRDIDNLTIQRTRPVPWRANYEVGSSRHKLAFDALLSWTALKTALRLRPDIIHAHLHEGALIGAAISRLTGAPLVFDFQGSMTAEMLDHGFLRHDGPFYRPLRWLERRIDHLPHAILTSSHHAAGHLIEVFGCPPARIHPIPDCVNTDFFSPPEQSEASAPSALRAELGIPEGVPVVVYLGLLADYQGTPDLIQAAAMLREAGADAHFLIMGFPNVDLYRGLAASLGLEGHITFTGKVPYELAPRYLALGDVAVAPKRSLTEGSGKILNYMAMALPTVAYDTPVSREYLGDLGVYAPTGDSHALAERIAGLIYDRRRATWIGRRLRERAVAHYSWDVAGRTLLDIYARLAWVRERAQARRVKRGA